MEKVNEYNEYDKTRIAILVGFKYTNGNKLPGITVDIYQVYTFLQKNGWKKEEIKIFTDLEKDVHTEVLKTAILEKTVDVGILSFIEDIKEKNQYIPFKSQNYQNNFSSLAQFSSSYVFIYYTGHFKEGNLILPDKSFCSLKKFINQFLHVVTTNEIFYIMDCCECKDNLPFQLQDKIFRLKFPYNGEKLDFFKNKILSISSSLHNEKALTSKSGSFFTKILFEILLEEKQSLSEILAKLKENKQIHQSHQTPNINSSYPNIYMLPGWIYSRYLSFNLFSRYLEVSRD